MQTMTATRSRRAMRLNTGFQSDISWQSGIRAFHEAVNGRYGYVESSHLNRERMSIRVEMPEVSEDMQPVYPKPAYRTTRRDRLDRERAEERSHIARIMDGDGIRASAALAAALVLALVLLICWTSNSSRLTAVQERIDVLNSRIAALDIEYENGLAAYEREVAKVDVGYAAVSQGLISSKGAAVIRLTVPVEAVIEDPANAEQGQRASNSRH